MSRHVARKMRIGRVKMEMGKPIVSMDYKSFGQDDDEKGTAIVIKDEITGVIGSHICDRKGADDEWVVNKLVEDIENMGHTEIILKGDGELAQVQVMQRMKEKRKHATIP